MECIQLAAAANECAGWLASRLTANLAQVAISLIFVCFVVCFSLYYESKQFPTHSREIVGSFLCIIITSDLQ